MIASAVAGSRRDRTHGKIPVASAFLIAVAVVTMAVAPAQAALTGTGTASALLGKLVEISVTDNTIAQFSASPTSGDPGPRAWSAADGFTFSNLFTNTRSMHSMDITSATDSGASSTETVQGTAHTIADWVYVMQDAGTYFTTYETTGTYDAGNGAAYTAPGGFTKDSFGTFTITYYDKTTPADGGDGTTTVNWIYDSAANKYMFDATDKDFSAGAQDVWPSSNTDETTGYTYTVQGNKYGVLSVANAGSNYVPTVRLAWQIDFSALGSVTNDAYLLLDFPSGTPADTYSITLTATATQLTS